MEPLIKFATLSLLVASFVYLMSGLTFMMIGFDQFSVDSLLLASIAFPLFLLTKGFHFLIANQKQKAFLTFSVFVIIGFLSVIFVFI